MREQAVQFETTAESRLGEILREVVTPQVYGRNPFAIFGMPILSTEQQLQRQFQWMKTAAGVGEQVWKEETSFHVNWEVGVRHIEDAFQELKDPCRRIVQELMWFWPQHQDISKVDPGMALLIEGDADGAASHWRLAESRGRGRIIATHNLAVLYHMAALCTCSCNDDYEMNLSLDDESDNLWNMAFEKWRESLGQDATWNYLKDRVEQIQDPRLTEWEIDELREEIPAAILNISKLLVRAAVEDECFEDATEHMNRILQSGFDDELIEQIKINMLQIHHRRVINACKQARQKVDADADCALIAVDDLVQETEEDREFLNDFDDLSDWDPAAEAADAVARELMNAAIDYGNATDDHETAVEYLEAAYNLARDSELEEKIQNCISSAKNIEVNSKAMGMREAAIDYANSTGDFVGTIRKLQGALRLATDEELVVLIRQDIVKAKSIIEQEQREKQQEEEDDRKSRLDIMIGADRVIVTPEIISYDGKSVRPKDVVYVGWGISKQYTNAVRTDRSFSVSVSTNNTSLTIECTTRFWESDNDVMARYRQVVDKVWRTVCVRLLTELIAKVSRGSAVEIGPFRIEKRGIWIKKTKMLFFSGEPELVPWGDLTWEGEDGYLKVKSRSNSSMSDSMDYKNANNAHILESFLDFLKDGNNFAKMQRGEL